MRRALPLLLLTLILSAAPAKGGSDFDELKDQLRHFDFKERLLAVSGLEAIGGEKAAELIAGVLDDEDWEVQIRALKALGSMGEVELMPQVALAAVEGEIILVRNAATQALHDMGIPRVFKKLLKGVIVKSAALKKLQILSQSREGPNVARWEKWYAENKDSLVITRKGYREEVPDDEYSKSKYLIDILKKAQIVCVLGKWDHAEIVLEHLGI